MQTVVVSNNAGLSLVNKLQVDFACDYSHTILYVLNLLLQHLFDASVKYYFLQVLFDVNDLVNFLLSAKNSDSYNGHKMSRLRET